MHLNVIVRVKEDSSESAFKVANEAVNGWKFSSQERMTHIACYVFQHRLRQSLAKHKLVAFIANGAILPHKSGVSHAPMASPPAVPFEAPKDSDLKRTIVIDMGTCQPYYAFLPSNGEITTSVSITGMAIAGGVTLIVGDGYHGKSILLRTIAAGVYNKIPSDGRELCVAVVDAVLMRAEDGQYVNNCNASAFISNLPTLPGFAKTLDTKNFPSREASGSTSKKSNVAEAMDMGATAILVDDDVSAANFMARYGRMRALVMDESITPLLYRVSGVHQTHGLSSIVVVRGVGD